MANIKSAKKRILVNRKKNLKNRMVKSEMQTAMKKFYACINKNDAEGAEKLLPETVSLIDSAVTKGVLHRNAASNRVAHLSKTLTDLKSGKLNIVIEEKKVRTPKNTRPVGKKPVKVVEEAPVVEEKVEEKPAPKTRAKKEKTETTEEAPKKTVKKAKKED